MKLPMTFAALAAGALLAGCATFTPTQKDAFLDDEGNILVAEYGAFSREYTYKIKSPMNGAELECRDKRAVRITLPDPDGRTLTFLICQKVSPKGTMYKTKDGQWLYWTIGLDSRLYL